MKTNKNSLFILFILLVVITSWSGQGLQAQAVGNQVRSLGNQGVYGGGVPTQAQASVSSDFFSVAGNKVTSSVRVLYHSRIKEYQVVYGLAEEAPTISAANAKMNRRIQSALDEIRKLGIPEADIYVDVVAQSRVYEYKDASAKVLKEEHVGYEMRKNIIIQFAKHEHLWDINDIMARNEIYDVIKVELVTESEGEVLAKINKDLHSLVEGKQKIIAGLLGTEMYGNLKIGAVHVETKYPEANYRSYTAKEGQHVTLTGYGPRSNGKHKIQARKFTTFYYQGDRASEFDQVFNMNDYRAIPTVDYVVQVGFSFDKI